MLMRVRRQKRAAIEMSNGLLLYVGDFAEVRKCCNAGCQREFVARDPRQQYCNLTCWEQWTRSSRDGRKLSK